MRHDGWTAHLAQRRQTAIVELTAALAQQHAEQGEKPAPVADTEQFQDVARVKAVHPFAEERGGLARSEQRLGQPAMQQAAVEIGRPKPVGAFVPRHGTQMHRFLPPRERVAELARRGQRGGPGRQYPESRIGIGRDLQQAAGIVQAVHLVENEHRSGRLTVEGTVPDRRASVRRRGDRNSDTPHPAACGREWSCRRGGRRRARRRPGGTKRARCAPASVSGSPSTVFLHLV